MNDRCSHSGFQSPLSDDVDFYRLCLAKSKLYFPNYYRHFSRHTVFVHVRQIGYGQNLSRIMLEHLAETQVHRKIQRSNCYKLTGFFIIQPPTSFDRF